MTSTAFRTRRDLEAQIGVDPIESLQSDRREVMNDLAPLRAKFGPGGTFDALRKQHRSAIANSIASDLMTERKKQASEAEIERLAAGDDRVLKFLTDAEGEMARYHMLDLQLTELTELIQRDQALIRYAANEPR